MGKEVEIRVARIFYSIQGEGYNQGLPTTFVRFQGCNFLVGCNWCDTQFARPNSGGTVLSVEEVLKRVVKAEPRTYKHWVCITGGEPLYQRDGLHELVKSLNKYGFLIEVETNGSLPKPFWWTLVDSWVADIKCPSSGMCEISREEDWFDTRRQDQVKFVVGSMEDILFAKQVIRRNAARNPIVLVSPVIYPDLSAPMMREAIRLCLEEKVRFSLQVHKYADVE